MSNSIKKILMTGATGYVADQMLPTFREKYETVLIDTRKENRRGEHVQGVNVVDLIDPDTSKYKDLFNGVDVPKHKVTPTLALTIDNYAQYYDFDKEAQKRQIRFPDVASIPLEEKCTKYTDDL